ncbi:hypothetical protein A3C91_04505 [Candidatus Azambacteria bacterium RIFCSPHIGHO2_02_FULL_52_12]|uniref:Yip1 domain-containing protein n=1 Tax=Candidatus Azambacteria bacterium RIFCSPLOWO2_01_FULL_46_25 TaxID=1797298 RepID=A0A1F5BV11_9BACT|nr:MAG: hypothetical protein A3C91_04505 [Candidatus Azambacteria bacterium RIFCSPHIGHO2_02_FULL_52_12]OGD34466.1 MAG: hypothetical protein A2988_03000 [Candidatus Azambacteria bacterium RIFCSPLOWO2_01_FULL_46_25]OGD37583.1 MAG: hypothetical protein A2850_03485 [Candidatus Azambacteria bacterium RIFCSPHIGHO2_01_FULL_51_74]
MKPKTYKFKIIFSLLVLGAFVVPAGFTHATSHLTPPGAAAGPLTPSAGVMRVDTTFAPPTATQTFSDLVCRVTNFISDTVLPPVAVLMMLVVGFMFLISAGDPGKSTTAKKALIFAVIGVFLLLLAPGIVALIASIFDTTLASSPACGATVVTGTLVNTLVGLVNWLSWFVAITSVVMGLYGGFLFITAKDDPAQATKARGVIAYTIIGIAVSVVAFSVIALVKGFL